jgi:two-component system, NarL family, invasion response regulator UvrY
MKVKNRHKKKMINLVVVDDHPLVREGVKKILSGTQLNVKVSGEASNANELYSILKEKEQPDIVILDVDMPGTSGLDVLKELQKDYPGIPVLMLSMHPAERFAVRSLKAGAVGYLTKGSIPDELEKAIFTVVHRNKRYISPEVAEKLAEQMDLKNGQPLHSTLSDREYQVMCLIASGKKVSEISEELNLSIRTVHTYRNRMMTKLKLKTNVEVAHYALNHELIDS